jgi:hypothetical protein
MRRAGAHLELFRAVRTDSILQTDSILIAFADSFVGTDLGRLDTLDARLAPELDKTDVGRLSVAVSLITPTDTAAALWQEVLYLAFSKWSDADTLVVLSSGDTARLEEISLLCPYEYGPAVYRARGLLFRPDTAWFALGHVCELGAEPVEPSFRLMEDGSEGDGLAGTDHGASIYPNPTTGQLHINLQYGQEDKAAWRMFDLTGRTVLGGREVEGQSRNIIDMSSLRLGVYLLELRVNEKPEKVWRIVRSGT